MTVRTSTTALKEDYERAAGSCIIASKTTDNEWLSAYLAGAGAALTYFPDCKNPEEFGSLISALSQEGIEVEQ